MKLIDRLENERNKRIRSIQKLLFLTVMDYLSARIKTDEDGTIRNTVSNLNTAAKLSSLSNAFKKDLIEPFVTEIAQKMFGILHRKNDSYFSKITKDKAATKVASKAAKDRLKVTLGFKNKRLASGSPLLQTAAIDGIWNRIRKDAIDAVSSGIKIKDFRNRINVYVEGAPGKTGELERHFNRVTGDIFSQYERQQGQMMATDLGLAHAIYQGGLIKTSRPFCEVRNGKVFTREEILAFGTPRDQFGGYENKSAGLFQGKNEPYNPLTDLGGYNCRHRLDWITNELAYRLRPELRK